MSTSTSGITSPVAAAPVPPSPTPSPPPSPPPSLPPSPIPDVSAAATAFVWIDDVDVTACCLQGSVTRALNRPAQAQVTLPYDCAIGGAGSRLKVAFEVGGSVELFFHGFVLLCETSCAEDTGTVVYNATDPMEMWQWRPARDYDSITPGNFVDPYFTKTLIEGGKQTGPQMVESMLRASEGQGPGQTIPETAEGPLFITLGGFESGGVDLSGIPVNWPMTIMEVVALLTSTGEVDVVLTPIDGGGNMAQVDVYNGDFGTDRSSSVVFEFGMGARNVQAVRWNEDMSNLRNKIQYFFTPKETTRRYKANITGDDPCLPGNVGNPGGVGGSLPDRPNFLAPGVLGNMIADSRRRFGVRMDIQTYDVDVIYRHEGCTEDAAFLGCCTDLDPTRILYRRLWQIDSFGAAYPRELIHVTPARDMEIGAFDIGDLVGINISPAIRGGTSGAQRIYQYTITWDSDDSVPAIEELQTSADQAGL